MKECEFNEYSKKVEEYKKMKESLENIKSFAKQVENCCYDKYSQVEITVKGNAAANELTKMFAGNELILIISKQLELEAEKIKKEMEELK